VARGEQARQRVASRLREASESIRAGRAGHFGSHAAFARSRSAPRPARSRVASPVVVPGVRLGRLDRRGRRRWSRFLCRRGRRVGRWLGEVDARPRRRRRGRRSGQAPGRRPIELGAVSPWHIDVFLVAHGYGGSSRLLHDSRTGPVPARAPRLQSTGKIASALPVRGIACTSLRPPWPCHSSSSVS
jgi:hypothetical protein